MAAAGSSEHEQYEALAAERRAMADADFDTRLGATQRCLLCALSARLRQESLLEGMLLSSWGKEAGDSRWTSLGERGVIAAQALRGHWGNVIRDADKTLAALRMPPVNFSGFVTAPTTPVERGTDDLIRVVLWCAHYSPGWLCAIGQLSEHVPEPKHRASLREWFWHWLDGLRAGPDASEDGTRLLQGLQDRGCHALADEVARSARS